MFHAASNLGFKEKIFKGLIRLKYKISQWPSNEIKLRLKAIKTFETAIANTSDSEILNGVRSKIQALKMEIEDIKDSAFDNFNNTTGSNSNIYL